MEGHETKVERKVEHETKRRETKLNVLILLYNLDLDILEFAV